WTRSQLLEMDDRFVAAVMAAFQAGGESLAAAGAAGRFRNGKAGGVGGGVGGGGNLLRGKKGGGRGGGGVGGVRARCPGVDVLCIRFGIEQRLRQRGAGW